MNIAVASGKGGTGKTTVASTLAVWASRRQPAVYLDCDVEEPNGALFIKPALRQTTVVEVLSPWVDEAACDGCGECVRVCAYRALVRLGTTVMVAQDLCHGCGGCVRACTAHALSEHPRRVGVLETGSAGALEFVAGRLDVGEAMATPLIRAVLRERRTTGVNVVDAPPGTSCPAVAAVRTCDYVVLVAEPTPFGLHDLALALEMVRDLGIAHGVVMNKCDGDEEAAEVRCREMGTEVIARVRYSTEMACAVAEGELALDSSPRLAGTCAEIMRAATEAQNRHG